jgi:endoglucanase
MGMTQGRVALRLCAAMVCGVLSGTGMPAAAAAGYRVQQGQVVDAEGRAVQLRGINLFGFDSEILIPSYLWTMGWKEQIAQIRGLGFNAVRLPFVPETLYSARRVGVDLDTYVHPEKNRDLQQKTPLEVLDLWLAEADRQGLYVVLDFHSVSRRAQYPTWHVEDPEHYAPGQWAETHDGKPYRSADWLRDLAFVARRYARHARFLGVDLYNEPNGVVRWGPADTAAYRAENDWKLAAEAGARAVLAANPRLLVLVQGIEANWDGREKQGLPINWGENLQPQAYLPLDIPADKLVLAPHTYGPDALQQFPKDSFGDPRFPANLAADWELLFGQFHPRHAVVLGEFGGFYGRGPSRERDRLWHEALVDYLKRKNMRSGFYWTYTPNSRNTGGILDDELQVRTDKMALLRRLWGSG